MLYSLCKTTILMIRYSDQTIAKYFIKQGAQIGQGCQIAVLSLGSQPYLVNIGNHVWVSRGVIFDTEDASTWIAQDECPDIQTYGRIVIEDNCFIGYNSHLLPNIRIGKNSIVGAGSVVITDIPPDSIVMGVPARVIGSTKKYKEKCIALWKQQKPLGYKNIINGKVGWAVKDHPANQRLIRYHLTDMFEK
jgi:acetyltransferase-like isoleucine patch superfamily enzyme